MQEIRLHWELFKSGVLSRRTSELIMGRLLSLQTLVNVEYLRTHPDTPALYDSGLRYAAEGAYNEEWKSIPVALTGDVLDCEDAATFRAAELIASGEDPEARAVFRGRMIAPGRRLYHVVTRRGDGTIEDPSRVLGMGTRKRPRRLTP